MRNISLISSSIILVLGLGYSSITRPYPVASAIENQNNSAPTLPDYSDVAPYTSDSLNSSYTWEQINLPEGIFGSNLIVHPEDASAIFLSVMLGLYESSDAGTNWRHVQPDIFTSIIDFEIWPGGLPRLYVYVLNPSPNLYRSDDWGQTWIKLASPSSDCNSSNCKIYTALSNKDRLYILRIEWNSAQILYLSDDGGQTWTSIPLSIADYIGGMGMAVSPTNSDLIFAKGSNHIYRSNDGGQNWSMVPIPTERISDIYFDPDEPHTLFLNAYPIGIIRSRDDGQSWQHADVGILAYYLTSSPLVADVLLIGDERYSYQFSYNVDTWKTSPWNTPEGIWEVYRSLRDNQVLYARTDDKFWRYIARNYTPASSLYITFVRKLYGDTPISDAQIALERSNMYREQVEAPRLALHPAIVNAAQNHANYIILNWNDPSAFTYGPHDEVEGKPGYTGSTLSERLIAADFPWSGGSEVIHFLADPIDSVDGWMSSVFHRLAVLDPDYHYAGYGLNQNEDVKVDVMDFGRGPAQEGIWFTKLPPYVQAYPINGQMEVPTSWDGAEVPNPLPPGASLPVGYPFTLQGAYGLLKITFAEMRDATGQLVSVHPNPPDCVDGFCYTLIAVEPFEPGVTYTVHAQGTVDNVVFDNTWTFTTAVGSD